MHTRTLPPLLALSASFLLAGASPLDARAAESTKCTTTHTGYFEVGTAPFGLSADHHVVYPAAANAAKFKVEFQRCPQLTRYGTASSSNYWGRLVAVESSTVAANQCLTSTPSSTSGIFYAKLTTCGSEYVPAADQSWVYMDDDFGKEILFAGQCSEQTGYLVDPNSASGAPLTTKGTDLVKLGCIDVVGRSVGTFTLSGLN